MTLTYEPELGGGQDELPSHTTMSKVILFERTQKHTHTHTHTDRHRPSAIHSR